MEPKPKQNSYSRFRRKVKERERSCAVLRREVVKCFILCGLHHHKIIATPIAPPKAPTSSHGQALDCGASPLCNPGVAVLVPDPPTPAIPLGVIIADSLA